MSRRNVAGLRGAYSFGVSSASRGLRRFQTSRKRSSTMPSVRDNPGDVNFVYTLAVDLFPKFTPVLLLWLVSAAPLGFVQFLRSSACKLICTFLDVSCHGFILSSAKARSRDYCIQCHAVSSSSKVHIEWNIYLWINYFRNVCRCFNWYQVTIRWLSFSTWLEHSFCRIKRPNSLSRCQVGS